MPFASCFSAIATASIVPGDSGSDGTQNPEIRSFRLAVDPPYGSCLRSLPLVAWPIPRVAVAPLLLEAIAGARPCVYQNHQVSSAGEFQPDALSEPYVNLSAHTAPSMEPRRTPI